MLINDINVKNFEMGYWGTYNPATIGPNTGPRKTLAVNILIAGPLPAADQISATTPDRDRINATFQ